MSSNDYLSIEATHHGEFVVHHRDADTHMSLQTIGVGNTLADAVEIANDWQRKNEIYVEYGLVIPEPKGKLK